jgi:hypothetical protein
MNEQPLHSGETPTGEAEGNPHVSASSVGATATTGRAVGQSGE